MSPPAQLAFDKARAIRPNYPAPYYFAGLARLFGEDWTRNLALGKNAYRWRHPRRSGSRRLESQLQAAKALQAQAKDSAAEDKHLQAN